MRHKGLLFLASQSILPPSSDPPGLTAAIRGMARYASWTEEYTRRQWAHWQRTSPDLIAMWEREAS